MGSAVGSTGETLFPASLFAFLGGPAVSELLEPSEICRGPRFRTEMMELVKQVHKILLSFNYSQ